MKKQLWLAAAAAVLMVPLMALAHAKLMSSSPAAGAQLGTAPQTLTLKFNESVELAALKLSADGKDIPLTLGHAAAAAEIAVPLPALAAGTYQVQWSALTVDDGHVVKGSFSFVVAGH